MTLREIILKAQAGDAGAFDALVRRFSAMTLGYALARLGDLHLAEDVAQEVMVDLYRSLPRLRQPEALTAVLRRMIAKHCDRLTRRRRHASRLLSDLSREPIDPHPDPSRAAERSEVSAALKSAMNRLTRSQREALTMFYLAGQRAIDVARFLGVSSAVFKSRLHRARAALKERLANMAEETLKQSSPDESFYSRVKQATDVFTAKGPAENHMHSHWDVARHRETRRILKEGSRGVAIDDALAQTPQSKLRKQAALHFGMRGSAMNARLLLMLRDPSYKVRRAALQSLARSIHPVGKITLFDLHAPADRVPAEVEHIFPFVKDPHPRVRAVALQSLRAYVGLGDARIESAIRQALDNPDHGTRHQAAAHLKIKCPGCGQIPKDNGGRVGRQDSRK